MPIKPEDILAYWLGSSDPTPAQFGEKQKLWYYSNAQTDQYIRDHFGDALDLAERGKLDDWAGTPAGAVALVILLDQFSRNLYRGTPGAYQNDRQAQQIVLQALDANWHRDLSVPARVIFYHPLHHAESLDLQERAVMLFEEMNNNASEEWRPGIAANLEFIRSHRDVVKRFGRFPHRNDIIGRPSSPAEASYLEQDERTYGQGAK